jgi:hypothetical protein
MCSLIMLMRNCYESSATLVFCSTDLDQIIQMCHYIKTEIVFFALCFVYGISAYQTLLGTKLCNNFMVTVTATLKHELYIRVNVILTNCQDQWMLIIIGKGNSLIL